MKLKRIGITLSSRINLYEQDFLNRNYLFLCSAIGVKPILIPNDKATVEVYLKSEKFDGFILTGGEDIEMLSNNDTQLAPTNNRDFCEFKILDFATKTNVPVFGICRGLQFINSYFGGSVTNEIHFNGYDQHTNSNHIVRISDHGYRKIMKTSNLNVNSFHNHGIRKTDISNDFKPFAISEDGVIEGIYHKYLRIAAIQWHPERRLPFCEADILLLKHQLVNFTQ